MPPKLQDLFSSAASNTQSSSSKGKGTISYPGLDPQGDSPMDDGNGLDVLNTDQPLNELFVPAKSSKPNYKKPSVEEESGDYYTTEQKKADREGGCTEEQISAIENVLKCDPKEWYDILGVSDTCTTEEAHQAYKVKSLALHPDRNPSKEATKAFQIIKDAADALKAGDEYIGSDAKGGTEDARKKPSQPRPEVTPFQKEIYDKATPHVLALIKDPSLKTHITELEKLNNLIKQQNEKDGKKEVDIIQGTIDYHTHIAMAKLVLQYRALINTPPTNDSERNKQLIAREKITQIGPNLDKLNTEKSYPKSWNIEEVKTPQDPVNDPIPENRPRQDPPPGPREPDTTREGYPIFGARQYGKGGYRFLVGSGNDDNPIEYRTSAELGYDIADDYLAGKLKKEWDFTKEIVSRAVDGKNYRGILGIASNPIKTAKIAIDSNGVMSVKPRYPESHMLTEFETPKGKKYLHVLSRSKLGTVIGPGAADKEIASFYDVRPKLTAPWATGHLAITFGNTRAIDAVPVTSSATNLAALPVMTPAMRIASQLTRTPAVNPVAFPNTSLASSPATDETLLLKNEVEGLKSQMSTMLSLLQTLSVNMPARPLTTA